MTKAPAYIAPYGLRVRLEPDPRELAVVRRIFAWHAEGLSLREIAGHLNSEKVPTKTRRAAKGWQAETVNAILKNRALYRPFLTGGAA